MVKVAWTFGDRFRKARLHGDLTTRELGTMLGVSHVTISNWELDRRLPDKVASIAAQVERVTGVPSHWLLFGCCQEGCEDVPL